MKEQLDETGDNDLQSDSSDSDDDDEAWLNDTIENL
jgi:hypothetical protein